MKILSDEENSNLNNILDELKRRVQHGSLNCQLVIDAINRMMHRDALTMDPARCLWKSGIFLDYDPDFATITANLLELDGFILNLHDYDRIDYMFRPIEPTADPKCSAIFFDFNGLRKKTLEHGIKVSWIAGENKPFIDSDPKDQNLEKWPFYYLPIINKLFDRIVSHGMSNVFLKSNGEIITY